MRKTIDNKISFPQLEETVLEFWDKNDIFKKSVRERPEENTFYFYDGPPFATGLPHYGHLIAGTIKDVVPRYQTMLGNRVERRFGWDCHGLPVEYEVEKERGLRGKTDIEALGVDKFNEMCRSIVLRYTTEWKNTIKRMGRWIDMENDYKTMDADFMESIWWVFKTLWEKKLIYESKKVVAYSPRLNTPVSNFEVNLAYKEVFDPSVTIKFKVSGREDTFLLAWTTTPWTLPSNLALAVHPEIVYAEVEVGKTRYYLAKSLIESNFGKETKTAIVKEIPGRDLAGISYEPLFPYYAEMATENSFRVILGDHVDLAAGTGIVHTAPSFGEDDFEMGKKYGLPHVMPIDDLGYFTGEAPDLEGRFFKDADKTIMRRLKSEQKVLKQETISHAYPFCWRSGSPLMYRTVASWFVNVEAIKRQMIENNRQIRWSPEGIKDGRMGKWLEGARDWAISRNRYWGNPIPVWICEECGHRHCIGSKKELEERANVSLQDLHSHFVDAVVFGCPKCGGSMKRTPEILDCWFESGAMPYGQQHYPFENKEKFDRNFPADFICEGLDQTRGWFYTLLVLGTALFQKPAFKSCIVNGMILAEDGKKMSKQLKNYPDPSEMLNRYGADAVRLYLLNSRAIHAEEFRFSETGLKITLRKNMIPLWNALVFFTTYANIDRWQPVAVESPHELSNPLDRWILSRLHRLIDDVRTSMAAMDLNRSVSPFMGFIDMLTNWYVRRSRRRFWKSGRGEDKKQAYNTLYTVLFELSKVIAPFIPFIAENIYRTLKREGEPESVHLCSYPEPDAGFRDRPLEEEMDVVQRSVNIGRALRSKHRIKMRQPLRSITLLTNSREIGSVLGSMSDLIADELNVKEVKIADSDKHLVRLEAKPNFKVLGRKLGKGLKTIRPQIEALSSETLLSIENGNKTTLDLEGQPFEVGADELLIQRREKEGIVAESEGDLTVALNVELSKDLIEEGLAREFVNKIQLTRKNREFGVTDRIHIQYSCKTELRKALEAHADYIRQETLADSLTFADTTSDEFVRWDINDFECRIRVDRR